MERKGFLFACRIAVIATLLLLGGCAAQDPLEEAKTVPVHTAESNQLKVDEIDQYDPLERFNRYVYRFNAWFDDVVFLPVVNAYDYVLPDVVKTGIHNFFANIGELQNLINSTLQLKGGAMLDTTERILVNSTIGIGGLMDVATDWGIARHDEDFGQTLGHWGVGAGPYLVLPLMGPSSLRDTSGLTADSLTFSTIDPLQFDDIDDAWEYGYYTLRTVDTRYQNKFRYYESGSPFEYELMRLLYLKMREVEVQK